MGAGETNLDLTNLSILSSIRYQMGVGQVVIVLPEKGKFTLKVDCAIGSVKIIAPKGMEVQLQADTALVNRSLPSGFLKTADNLYTSPGFAASENQVKVEVDLAIGQVVILQK
jgi:predicted membrane protein